MPKEKLWPLEPHTRGKHIVLKAYLDAWLPVLGFTEGRILFIDGFAGPGEYADGEWGSPLIALDAFASHRSRGRMSAEVFFVFVEEDEARAEHLRDLVKPYADKLPDSTTIVVECGNCLETLNEALDRLDVAGSRMAPAFVMLDPFGVMDTPMSLVERVLRHPKCEVYISFMWEWINRFKGEEKFAMHLDALFGTSDWRAALDLPKAERKQFLYDVYERQLRASGAKFVTYFELWNEGRHVYTIFFATKHPKGMDLMKQAIWKADRSGGYRFIGRRGGQIDFEVETTDLTQFAREIRARFGGRAVVPIEEIEEWAMSDATDFHSAQLKKALKIIEDTGALTAVSAIPGKKRRARTYPALTRVTISPPT